MHRKLYVSVLAAAFMLFAVGVASAGRLSITSRNFRATWSSLEFEGAGLLLRCPVTLEGSYHSATIRKTTGALIGHITRAAVANASCTGGRVTALAETLPWHVTYEGFEGTLPVISGITDGVVKASFIVESSGITCTVESTAGRKWKLLRKLFRHLGTALLLWEIYKALREFRIPWIGGFFCAFAEEASIAGEGLPTVLGSTTMISIALI